MIDLFLLRTGLRDLMRPKRLFVACLLIAGPACVALVLRIAMRGNFDSVATYGALASLLVFGFVLPILSVVFGTGVIAQELEQKTIGYLLTRPIPRWRILLWKFAAVVVMVTVTAWLSVLVLAAATYSRGASSGRYRLHPGAIASAADLCSRLQVPEDPVSDYLRSRMSERTIARLDAWNPSSPPRPRLVQSIVNDLNRVIERDANLYNADRFSGVQVPADARQLLADRPTGEARTRLNRWLLEAAYPELIPQSRSTIAHLPRDLMILPIGALAYGALFLLIGTLINRALLVGLFLAFGWETWVPLLPGNFKLVSVMTYLRALAPHARPETASVDITGLFNALNPEAVPASLAWWVLGVGAASALVLAMGVFSFREYVPKDDST